MKLGGQGAELPSRARARIKSSLHLVIPPDRLPQNAREEKLRPRPFLRDSPAGPRSDRQRWGQRGERFVDRLRPTPAAALGFEYLPDVVPGVTKQPPDHVGGEAQGVELDRAGWCTCARVHALCGVRRGSLSVVRGWSETRRESGRWISASPCRGVSFFSFS